MIDDVPLSWYIGGGGVLISAEGTVFRKTSCGLFLLIYVYHWANFEK